MREHPSVRAELVTSNSLEFLEQKRSKILIFRFSFLYSLAFSHVNRTTIQQMKIRHNTQGPIPIFHRHVHVAKLFEETSESMRPPQNKNAFSINSFTNPLNYYIQPISAVRAFYNK